MQHAVQLWVNLPKAHKMIAPRYQALNRDTIPEVEFDGGVVRVIAGELKMQDAQ
jgi:redox-sensitive bicupin YhaK (pirin superfamily)